MDWWLCVSVSFSGASSFLWSPGRRVELVISTGQLAKCWSITLAKQEEGISSFLIYLSAGTGWRWGSSYSSLTSSQNLLCKYLRQRLSASFCIELFFFFLYCIFRNESWQLKSYQHGYCTDLWVFISKRAIPWLVTKHKSAAVAAALAHLRRTRSINDKPEQLACTMRHQQGCCENLDPSLEDFCPIFGELVAQPRVLFQPAGGGLIHLIKTDLMIETKALFITLDFHTRHDSRLFHLWAFICRNEEWVPIFKLTLPYFLLYKWPSMLFLSFTSNLPFLLLSLSSDVAHPGNKGVVILCPTWFTCIQSTENHGWL